MCDQRKSHWWMFALALFSSLPLVLLGRGRPSESLADAQRAQASIDVDASQVTGKVSPYIFGQNLEHEHGTISGGEQNLHHEHGLHSGGLWAEMLRDRKFEEGDRDGDGVADGWVPEERIENRFWELVSGRGPVVRYRVARDQYYGGGASQAIELYGSGSNHASIYQVGLHFGRAQTYRFYVYLKSQGAGSAWVEFATPGKPPYARKEFPDLSENWDKYVAEFTSPEETDLGRVRIAVRGTGVFWIDSASLMPADNHRGMRRDVVETLKPLRVPIVRYPGGCFADTYHWRDGMGPRDRRPERWSSMWNEWEPNDFGTDEFMDFTRELGADAHITANYLSGTPEEAAQWVEYTNASAQTRFGSLRVQNGHPEPYGIKIWAIGNEAARLCSDAYFDGNDLGEYVKRFEQYKTAIQKVDPSVQIMAVGAPPGPLEWNRELFRLASFDLLAASIYTGEGKRMDDFDTKITDLNYFYRKVVAEPLDFARVLDQIINAIGERLPKDHPPIAITEFNSWWLTEKVDPDFRLCNALYIAGVFHALMRRAKQVFMGEVESLLDIQGIVEVSQTQVKLTPEYFAFLLYRNHAGSSVLATSTSAPAVSFNPKLPALDAIATLSEGHHTIHLAVINRNESEDLLATVRIHEWMLHAETTVRIFELNGKDRDATNPFGSTENVNIREKSVTISRPSFPYRFPAHSVTVLELSGTT